MRLIRLAGRARHTLERIAHSAANARMVRGPKPCCGFMRVSAWTGLHNGWA